MFINFMSREIALKLVYFGQRGAGITASLDHVWLRRGPPKRGLVLDSPGEGGPSFDLPIPEAKTVRGFGVRAVFFERIPAALTRGPALEALVKGADGVVFVADGRAAQREGDVACARLLAAALADAPVGRAGRVTVVQVGHRDDPQAATADHVSAALALGQVATIEAVPPDGRGVLETVVGVLRPLVRALHAMPPPP